MLVCLSSPLASAMLASRFGLLLCAAAASALKVTVAGGSGFVGSRVCKYLVDGGADVVALSKSGAPPAWAVSEGWSKSVSWVANDLVRGSMGDLEAAVGKPDAFVSCVGSVGFDRQGLLLGNGKANVDAAKALAKIGSVQRVAYVSVSEELFDSSGWLPGFFVGCASTHHSNRLRTRPAHSLVPCSHCACAWRIDLRSSCRL